MSKRVTHRDIAKACGVSVYTVSSVFNKKGDISQKTADAVYESARKLGYDPLKTIPLIQKLSTKTIALVLPHEGCFSNSYYHRAIHTTQSLALASNIDMKVFTEAAIHERILQTETNLQFLGCDAVVFFCPQYSWETSVTKLRELNIPAAVIRRQCTTPGVVTVVDDDSAGMTMVMEHLRELGHSCIAMVNKSRKEVICVDRQNAYTAVVSEHGLPSSDRMVVGLNDLQEPLEERVLSLVNDEGVTAFACIDDSTAVSVSKILLQKGIRIPDDISVTGYNDDPGARLFYPELTTVHIPIEKMVNTACESLLHYTESSSEACTSVRFSPHLVVRESTGPCPNARRRASHIA